MIAFDPHAERSSKLRARERERQRERRPAVARPRRPCARPGRASARLQRRGRPRTTITSGRVRRQPVDEPQEPRLHVVDEGGLVGGAPRRRTAGPAGRRRARSRAAAASIDGLAEPLPDLLGSVAVVDPCEVGERPRRRERRWRSRRGDRARPSSTGTSGSRPAISSSASRDFPTRPRPTIVTRTGAARGDRPGRGISRRIVSSLERPTNGIVRRTDRVVRPSTGCAGRSSVESLGTDVPALAERDLGLGERVRRSPTSTSPGPAAVCRRAAAFTTGPVTRSCPAGPSPVAATPDSIPTRTSSGVGEAELVAQSPDAAADREARRGRPAARRPRAPSAVRRRP